MVGAEPGLEGGAGVEEVLEGSTVLTIYPLTRDPGMNAIDLLDG